MYIYWIRSCYTNYNWCYYLEQSEIDAKEIINFNPFCVHTPFISAYFSTLQQFLQNTGKHENKWEHGKQVGEIVFRSVIFVITRKSSKSICFHAQSSKPVCFRKYNQYANLLKLKTRIFFQRCVTTSKEKLALISYIFRFQAFCSFFVILSYTLNLICCLVRKQLTDQNTAFCCLLKNFCFESSWRSILVKYYQYIYIYIYIYYIYIYIYIYILYIIYICIYM